MVIIPGMLLAAALWVISSPPQSNLEAAAQRQEKGKWHKEGVAQPHQQPTPKLSRVHGEKQPTEEPCTGNRDKVGSGHIQLPFGFILQHGQGFP